MYSTIPILASLGTGKTDSHQTVSIQTKTKLPDFASKIEHEFIDGSVIAPDLFSASVEFIEDTGFWEPNRALNHRIATQYQTRRPHNFGTIAAFRNEDGSLWQAKPERPRYDEKKGKSQKYETPISDQKGNGSRAFLPPIPISIRQKISVQYRVNFPSEGSFWNFVAAHPEIPIVLTEGGKKALCLLGFGYLAISLYGVDGAGIFNEWIGREKIRKLKPELIPDLQRFAVPGRNFILAFDRDPASNLKAQQSVTRGISRTGKLLADSGCNVTISTWDGRDGKGIDDLIVNCGVVAWEKSLSEAVTFSQWTIERRLACEIRRKPDLNIGNREFIEVASELPGEGMLSFWGNKGTGKSKAIGKLIGDRTWLSITSLISLGKGQAETWGGVFVNDADRHGSRLLKDGSPVNGGSVCVPSLLKISTVEAEILILDELTATLEFLLGSKLANKNGIRSLLLAEFVDRVRRAKLILIADADLTEETLQFIETIRGECAYLVKSERQSLTYEATVIDGSKNSAIALLQQQNEALNAAKVIYINTDSKAYAEALTELLGHEQTLLITSETSGGEIESRFLSSKGRDLPWLIGQGIRFIISSPSVVQGFSIEHHTDLIDSVWGFYSGCSIAAHAIAQAPDRVRDSGVPRFFWIAKKGSAYNPLSKAQSIIAFQKEFEQLRTVTARLVRNSLTPETQSATDQIDWQSENVRMLSAIEVRRNQGMGALRDTLIALLKREGKQVKILTPEFSKAELQAVGQLIKNADKVVNRRHCEAVERAINISQEDADRLSNQTEALTSEQDLSLKKFRIRQFYRLETVTSDDVQFDRKGRTQRQIKQLESILYPETATTRTVQSIEQNPNSPQDWNSIALRVWVLEQSGAARLIRSIAAGEIEALIPDLIDPIAEFIRSHSAEFRIAFNFRDISKLTNRQIIGEILTRHGIRTKRRGNKNNLRYEVCKPELEALLAIIERRRRGIAPLENQEVNQRGAIPLNVPKSFEPDMTLEDLTDIRELYELANSLEAREALRQIIPSDVLRRAISA